MELKNPTWLDKILDWAIVILVLLIFAMAISVWAAWMDRNDSKVLVPENHTTSTY